MFFSNYKDHSHAKIRESLFWEYRVSEMDKESMKNIIVQKVIERGRMEDFYAIFNLYGIQGVKEAVKELAYLNNKDIAFACVLLDLKKTDLKCYIRKQLPQQHWNS